MPTLWATPSGGYFVHQGHFPGLPLSGLRGLRYTLTHRDRLREDPAAPSDARVVAPWHGQGRAHGPLGP